MIGAVTTGLVFFHELATSSWPLLVIASALLLAGIGIFAYVGSTQTNRTKPWARALEARYVQAQPDRFSTDQAAAARFGLYTAVIWVVAIIVFVVVGILGYWAWSWLALGAAVVVMLLVLARMLFGESSKPKG